MVGLTQDAGDGLLEGGLPLEMRGAAPEARLKGLEALEVRDDDVAPLL